MDNYELCEKLVGKTGVSYSDAKDALERSGWDMLDAILLLESEGKISADPAGKASFADGTSGTKGTYCCAESKEERRKERKQAHAEHRGQVHGFLAKCRRFITENRIIAFSNSGKQLFDVPIWVMLLALCAMSWIFVVLLLVSFVIGWQYKFEGPELGKTSVNDATAKVGNVVYNVGKDIHSHFDEKGPVNVNYTVKEEEEQK